ncbi:MAG: hypothetical protein AAB152_13480 [Candidatus Coatesbacteria bacterium]
MKTILAFLAASACAVASAGAPVVVKPGTPNGGMPQAGAPGSTLMLDRAAIAPSFEIRLSGDPLTATPLETEDLGVIPFGRWLNAITLSTVQQGFQFAAELEYCSIPGCIVTNEDAGRVIIAKRDIADAVRLGLYDEGWARFGSPALSEENRLAVPVAGPGNKREIWVLKRATDGWRMHRRYPIAINVPIVLRYRDDDLYMLFHANSPLDAARLDLATGKVVSATPIEAYWYECVGGTKGHWAIGPIGDHPEELGSYQSVPIWQRGNPRPGLLELNASCRPMTSGGFAAPALAQVDCLGRICIVSAMSEEIWCLRFGPDGALLNGSKIGLNIAGTYRAIQIDARGRFYFLVTEMDEDGKKPKMLHFVRMK